MAIDVVRRSPEEVAGESYTAASQALSQGAHGMELLALHIPYALGHNEDGYIAWRKRILPPDHKIVELDRFEDYLLKPVREGFGLPSLYFLDGAMKLLGQKGKPALAALRQEIPDWDERIQRNRSGQTGQDAPRLAEHGGDRKSEGMDQGDVITLKRGTTSAPYLAARLKRDAPEIAERLANGQFKSVRAAAIEAGIVKPPQPLEQAKRLWLKMGQEERFDFWRWAHEQ